MKKEIRQVDEEKRIMQVTTADERWYIRESTDEKTGLPTYEYVPSVTWIAGFYPKGIEFMKWLANNGWDESQAIKRAAGTRGSKVHYAITALLSGEEVPMDRKFLNPDNGQEEELALDEYECLISFVDWYTATKPRIIGNELVIWNDEYGFAGTIDLIAEIEGQTYIIDFKTGQNIWPEYELQVSAYRHSVELEDVKLAILQIGYRRNKCGWKFTELKDKFGLFLAAREIWANETAGEKPKQKDYPLALSLVPVTSEAANDNNHEEQQGTDEGSRNLPEAAARD